MIAALLCGLAQLCDSSHAAPFVYETPGEFLTTADFNGDGVPDVLLLDKITGNARVGYGGSNGVLTWSAPLPTGVPNPTGCAAGRFQQTGWDTVAVTAPSFNAVNLVDLSQTNTAGTPAVVTPNGVGPHTILPLANPLGGTPPAFNNLLVASSENASNNEELDLMSLNAGTGTEVNQYPESGPFDRGNALQLSVTPASFAVGLVRGATNDTLDIWQFTNAPAIMVSFTNWVSGGDYVFGVFNQETLPRFIFYQPGGTNLTVIPLLATSTGFAFGTPINTNVAEAIQGIFYLDLTGNGNGNALIEFSDGVEGLSLPGGVPAFSSQYASGAAAGDVFSGVVPLGPGQFALLDAPAGSLSSAHAQVVQFDGTHFTQHSSANLPATTARNTRANVWLFQTEPFVNRAPGLVAATNSPDWSDSIANLPDSVTVQTETYNGTNSGLGSAAAANLGAAPVGATTNGLVNQYSPVISLFSYAGCQAVQPVNVTISPPPGQYSSPLSISFSTLNPSDRVLYRIQGADVWHVYTAAFVLTNDNTIVYYGTNAASPLRSQLQSATYGLNNNNQLALQNGASQASATNGFTPYELPPVLYNSDSGVLFYGRRSTSNLGTVWAIHMDGSDDTYITQGARPRASRDGQWLAFLREGNPFANQGNLWTRNLLTGQEQRLLVNTNTIVGFDWEPDDSGLVLDYGSGLWRLDTNGSLTLLTVTNCLGKAPVLNPQDGRMACHDLSTNTATGFPGLLVLTYNASALWQIVTNVSGASWPAWSPDGQLLCFSDDNSPQSVDQGTNLWLVSADGSQLNRVCDFAGTDNRFPHGALWTLDGGSLVGAGTFQEANGLWVIGLNADRTDCAGEDAVRLPTTPGDPIDFAGSVVPSTGLYVQPDGTITIDAGKPVIIQQPASTLAGTCNPVTVSVTAIGEPPLAYEWIKDGVLLPAQTNQTLVINCFQLTNSGVYQAIVSNPEGLAISYGARLLLTNAPFRGWGDDGDREVSGSTWMTNYPVAQATNVVMGAMGFQFSTYVGEDGTLWTLGANEYLQMGLGVEAFSCPEQWTDTNPPLFGWTGYGLQIVTTYNQWQAAATPLYITQPNVVAGNVTALAAGQGHELIATGNGSLMALGSNDHGQLGAGVWQWFIGMDAWGGPVYGNNAFVSYPVGVAEGVTEVAAGASHSLFVKADGTLWGMGDDNFGEIGVSKSNLPQSPGYQFWCNGLFYIESTPVVGCADLPLKVADNVVAVAAGDNFSLYVTAGGWLWGMGYNNLGQLGLGMTNTVWRPELLASNVVAVAAGSDFSLFLTADGILWGMGDSSVGQLGLKPGPPTYQTNSLVPIQLASGVASMTALKDTTIFIKRDGTVWGMGNNVYGTLCSRGTGTAYYNVMQFTGLNGGALVAANVGKGGDARHCLSVMGELPWVGALTNQIVLPGASATFAVQYTNGDGNASIQWQFNGANIPGANNTTITLTNIGTNNVGSYTAVVTGSYGSVSTSAGLYLNQAPFIASQPVGGSISVGQPASLSIAGSFTFLPPSYQWMKDGMFLPNQTNSTLNIPCFQFANSGSYQVVISNADGMAISVPALLSLSGAPLRAWGYNLAGELGDGTNNETVYQPKLVAANVAAVAVGQYHSLFIKGDGTLWAMGNNESGELGDGIFNYTNYSDVPVQVTNNVVAVAAAGRQSLFVRGDGTLWVMGQNEFGTNSPVPVDVASNVVAVSSGFAHTLLLSANGTLWTIGENSDGELGVGSAQGYTTYLVAVASNVVAISAGEYHSLFMKVDGSLWGMGYNGDGELGNGTYTDVFLPALLATNVLCASGGENYSLFLTPDHTLWGMGQNGFALSSINYSRTNLPVVVASNVVTMAASADDSYYIAAGGQLWARGANYEGQLGVFTSTNGAVLVGGGGLAAVAMARGPDADHELAVAGALPAISPLTNQTVLPAQPFSFSAVVSGDGPFTYQWQLNGVNLAGATSATYGLASASVANAGTYTVVVTNVYGSASASVNLNVNYAPIITGQPAGTTVAAGQPASASVSVFSALSPVTYEWLKDGVLLPGQTNSVLSISSFELANCGTYQVLAANAAGLAISRPFFLSLTNVLLRAWGANLDGQLGDGTLSNTNWPVVVASNVIAEAVGGAHSIFLTTDGGLWAMGYNNCGQIGGAASSSHAPEYTNLPVRIATNLVAVAAGQSHSLGLTADGNLWGWGAGSFGQLGTGFFTNDAADLLVATNVVSVAAGAYHSLYLTADGALWTLGQNSCGQLGNGSTASNWIPSFVASNVVSIAAGANHSLYLTADGNLWTMGNNAFGQLDNGTTNNAVWPAVAASQVIALAGGGNHTLFVQADGTLWGAGYNRDGELGVGNTSNVSTAVEIAGNVAAVAAGAQSSLYLTADGTLWATGDNASDELGDGLVTGTYLPVRVNQGGLVAASFAKGPCANHELTVAGALPVISLPSSQIARAGQPFSFGATVTAGDGPFAYQWQLNGTNIPGAFGTVFNGLSASATSAGVYTVVVSNLGGNSSASTALNFISTQPAGGVVTCGQPASVSVTTNSPLSPVGFEWLKDGVRLPGQTNRTLSFASFQLTNCGAYQVVFSNASGLTISVPAYLSVSNLPLRAWGYNDYGQLGDGTRQQQLLPEEISTNVIAAAAGANHSLYLAANGNLWGMGDNEYGQLGIGAQMNTNLPVMVATNVAAVAAGQYHSLYLTADGTLWGMGDNDNGQLGIGTQNNAIFPVRIAANVVSVAVGQNHSLYLTANGTLWGMGYNGDGELANVATASTNRPVILATNAVAVAAGGYHSLYLAPDGTLYANGYNAYGQLGNASLISTNRPVAMAGNVVAVAGGNFHSLYITGDGRLWAAGLNNFGQLGDGTVQVRSQAVVVASSVTSVAAGSYHSLFTTRDGALWAVGDNSNGQLGDGNGFESTVPVRVNNGGMLTANLAKGPAAWYQSLAVAGMLPAVTLPSSQLANAGQPFSLGSVVSAGDGPFAYQWQFNGTNISGATNLTYGGVNAVAADDGIYTLTVTAAWGSASGETALRVSYAPMITAQPAGRVVAMGQPVAVSVTATSQTSPVTYEWLKDGMRLPAQTNSTLAFAAFQLTNSGSYQVVVSNAGGICVSVPALLCVSNAPLRAWGANEYGQLGDGTLVDEALPEIIGTNVVAVAAGGLHSLFLGADGSLWGMGYNGYGELGVNSQISADVPLKVTTNVVAVAAGAYHSLYLRADGTLWGMGYNYDGELGVESYVVSTPSLIASNVVALAAGQEHSLYVTADGTLWGMGYNGDGELGNLPTASTNQPAILATNVISVAAGGYHSMYLAPDGTLYGTGNNIFGQLGSSLFLQTNQPVVMARNVVAMAGGNYHSLYITGDGTLWAMGNNSDSQLGDGGTEQSHGTPVAVATNVVSVAAGLYHSLYTTADGVLWAMGDNAYGQLGTDTGSVWPMPVNNRDMLAAVIAKGPAANHSLTVAGAAPRAFLDDLSTIVGQPFSFNPAISGGDAPYTCQWQFDSVDIPSATSADYGLPAASLADAGEYTLVITGPFNSSSSSAALSVLSGPPQITAQPVSSNVAQGQPAFVAVGATDSTAQNYEWIKDGVLLPGQTSNRLSIASFQLTNSGLYQVIVSNSLGLVISRPAFLSLSNAPLRAWGCDYSGQLGDSDTSPVSSPELIASNVVAAAVGGLHSLYLAADGSLWGMGNDYDGELGDAGGSIQYWPMLVATNVVALAAGEDHSLYLTADGTLWGMGQNSNGQLGNHTPGGAAQPVATNVVAVAAGGNFSLYLTADGTLWGMGDNTAGQLGDGTTGNNNQSVPETISTGVAAMAAGPTHTLFVKIDGSLWAMGDNSQGELGDGGTELNMSSPELITNNVVAVAAGGYSPDYSIGGSHSLYLTADGGLWVMGYNEDGELGDGGLESTLNQPEEIANNVVAIAAGAAHSLYVMGDGSLWAMGDDSYGELAGNSGSVPQLVGTLVAGSLAKGATALHVLSIAGQTPQAYVPTQVVTNGRPFSVTVNIYGGDGPFTCQWLHNGNPISGATNLSLTAVFTDASNPWTYSVVVQGAYGSSTDYAYLPLPAPAQIYGIWASQNGTGQPAQLYAGISSWIPCVFQWLKDGVLLRGQTNYSIYLNALQIKDAGTYQIAVSNSMGITLSEPCFLGLTNAFTLAWGANNTGQLGDGTTNNASLPEILASNVVAQAAGASHSLYLTDDGILWAAGANSHGQLGNGIPQQTSQPQPVDTNAVAIAAGGGHSLYVLNNGTLWAMGWNNHGQLGDGTTNDVSFPESITNNVVAVAAGASHSLFITQDGRLWAAGLNSHGQLGNGITNDACQPVLVASNVVSIAAGGAHSLFLTLDGNLWGMGAGQSGQLGAGVSNDARWPVLITNGVLAIAAGDAHSLYVTASGMLWSMGANSHGQLGNGTTNNASRPVNIASAVVSVAAGPTHSLYVASDGRVWGMGQNSSDQLGIGTLADVSSPVLVNGGGMTAASLARGAESSQAFAIGTVQPAVFISNVSVSRSGCFIQLVGAPGAYVIQTSVDLIHWNPLGAAISTTPTTFNFTDTNAPSTQHRFYRVLLQP